MKDLELLRYLKKNDAVFVDESTQYAGQVRPALKILDSRDKTVCLPDGVHINHAVCVLERPGAGVGRWPEFCARGHHHSLFAVSSLSISGGPGVKPRG